MQNLVDAVIANIDPGQMRELIALKSEAEGILDEIRYDIESVQPEISFWDRINIFQTTESEAREEQYRRELIDERNHLYAIRAEIREKVVVAIDKTYSVRLKLHMGLIYKQAEDLRDKRGSKRSSHIKGKKQLLELITFVEEDLCDRFGLDYGRVEEEELIEAILKRLGA
jgi:hypothetical protein